MRFSIHLKLVDSEGNRKIERDLVLSVPADNQIDALVGAENMCELLGWHGTFEVIRVEPEFVN